MNDVSTNIARCYVPRLSNSIFLRRKFGNRGDRQNDIWDNLLSTLIREKRFRKPSLYHNLIFLLENDWSSVWPRFGIKNETSLIGELSKEKISKGISEENIAIEMLEHDFVVKMSPRRRYKVHVLVRSRRKGEPRAVEFDNDLLTE